MCCNDSAYGGKEECGGGICGLLLITACFGSFCGQPSHAYDNPQLSVNPLNDINTLAATSINDGDEIIIKSFMENGRNISLRVGDPISLNRDYKIEGAPTIGGIAVPEQWNFSKFLQEQKNRENIANGIAQIIIGGTLSAQERQIYENALIQLGFKLDKDNTPAQDIFVASTAEMTANPIIRAEFFAINLEPHNKEITKKLTYEYARGTT